MIDLRLRNRPSNFARPLRRLRALDYWRNHLNHFAPNDWFMRLGRDGSGYLSFQSQPRNRLLRTAA